MKKYRQKSPVKKEAISDDMLKNVSGGSSSSAVPGSPTVRLDYLLKRLFRGEPIVQQSRDDEKTDNTSTPSITEEEQAILDSMPRPGTGNPADDDPGVPTGL